VLEALNAGEAVAALVALPGARATVEHFRNE
jgi:hypothetical protein